MKYTTVYVGMDVHKESFTLACYTNEKEEAEYVQKTEGHYSKVINYLEAMRFHYGDDVDFVCGYEAGCLGYTLYHDLDNHGVKCVILAPSTMEMPGGKRIKTDKRDAYLIAKCLANGGYKAVHIPSDKDEDVRDYLRMRDDHRDLMTVLKQQINALCLRNGHKYTKSRWTGNHLKWLKELELSKTDRETLNEYMLTYQYLAEKLARLDNRIEELSSEEEYADKVKKLRCYIGINTYSALGLIVETGDFQRFAKGNIYSAYLGLTPGERSSSDDKNRLGITKAGNKHARTILVEAAQSICRGTIGAKSKALISRQRGNDPAVIAYADKANERLRRKYRKMMYHGKQRNVAVTAVARELACYVWGMMTDNIGTAAI